ncbi:hypothetical protein [Nocardia nova]|uniref:hypothetical protein n=1 Tax=Nocardia nova TaxID=37330 RepID=UPI002157350C|nr:hypothetical protein [Nocardia nova]
MSPEQVLRVIPAFHPVWETADAEVISFADAHAGHGNFRNWAKLTAHTVRALPRLERDHVDQQVLGAVFASQRVSPSAAKLTGRTG